jgi:hypothetical protein
MTVSFNLVRRDREPLEGVLAEGSRHGHIGRVAPPCHQNTADTGDVVPGIERVPPTAEVDFEPAAEIHRACHGRDANKQPFTADKSTVNGYVWFKDESKRSLSSAARRHIRRVHRHRRRHHRRRQCGVLHAAELRSRSMIDRRALFR